MSNVTIINLPNHVTGDTFDGYQFNGFDESNVAYDLTGATLSVAFKRGGVNGTIVQTMAIGSGLSWVNQSSGQFKINQQTISYTADIYYYEVEITFADTTQKSPIKGTWKITPQITP